MGRKRRDEAVKGKQLPGLSSHEQETIITFDKESKNAEVFTYEKTWQRHLEERLHLTPKYDNGFGGRAYELDKKRISKPKAPRTGVKRQMTPEHLAKLKEGRKRARELS